jgi:hypothetical protein
MLVAHTHTHHYIHLHRSSPVPTAYALLACCLHSSTHAFAMPPVGCYLGRPRLTHLFVPIHFQMLRDEFKYSPKLNKAQFFSTAFAEQKMLLTKDIIAHCYAKHNELNKHSSSPSKRQTGSHRVLLPPELGPSYSDFGPVPTDTSWVGSPARPNKSTDGHSHVPISATASLATHDAAVQGTKYGFRPDVGSHHDGVGSASTITAQPVYPRPVDRLYNPNSPPLPLLLFFTSSCLLSLLCFNVKCLTSRADCAP